MRGSIELPNMCDLNRIPGMLSDVLVANDKNIFPRGWSRTNKHNFTFSLKFQLVALDYYEQMITNNPFKCIDLP